MAVDHLATMPSYTVGVEISFVNLGLSLSAEWGSRRPLNRGEIGGGQNDKVGDYLGDSRGQEA